MVVMVVMVMVMVAVVAVVAVAVAAQYWHVLRIYPILDFEYLESQSL